MAKSIRKPLNVEIDTAAILEKVGKMNPKSEKDIISSSDSQSESIDTQPRTEFVKEQNNNINSNDIQTYNSIFLVKKKWNIGTKNVRIDIKTHDQLSRFISVLSHTEYSALSIVDYVNNVLQDHINKYGDKMNELYKKYNLTSINE